MSTEESKEEVKVKTKEEVTLDNDSDGEIDAEENGLELRDHVVAKFERYINRDMAAAGLVNTSEIAMRLSRIFCMLGCITVQTGQTPQIAMPINVRAGHKPWVRVWMQGLSFRIIAAISQGCFDVE